MRIEGGGGEDWGDEDWGMRIGRVEDWGERKMEGRNQLGWMKGRGGVGGREEKEKLEGR